MIYEINIHWTISRSAADAAVILARHALKI